MFTRFPLTKVPSTLPMSMIDSFPSGATSMTEWMRLTLSSSRQRWAEASRPILMMSRSSTGWIKMPSMQIVELTHCDQRNHVRGRPM